MHGKTRVIDIDLKSYFDGVRHDLLLAKIARRINDDDVLRLLKMMLKANGKQGVPQGGVITPLTQKQNFQFERVVTGWRAIPLHDMRLKR